MIADDPAPVAVVVLVKLDLYTTVGNDLAVAFVDFHDWRLLLLIFAICIYSIPLKSEEAKRYVNQFQQSAWREFIAWSLYFGCAQADESPART